MSLRLKHIKISLVIATLISLLPTHLKANNSKDILVEELTSLRVENNGGKNINKDIGNKDIKFTNFKILSATELNTELNSEQKNTNGNTNDIDNLVKKETKVTIAMPYLDTETKKKNGITDKDIQDASNSWMKSLKKLSSKLLPSKILITMFFTKNVEQNSKLARNDIMESKEVNPLYKKTFVEVQKQKVSLLKNLASNFIECVRFHKKWKALDAETKRFRKLSFLVAFISGTVSIIPFIHDAGANFQNMNMYFQSKPHLLWSLTTASFILTIDTVLLWSTGALTKFKTKGLKIPGEKLKINIASSKAYKEATNDAINTKTHQSLNFIETITIRYIKLFTRMGINLPQSFELDYSKTKVYKDFNTIVEDEKLLNKYDKSLSSNEKELKRQKFLENKVQPFKASIVNTAIYYIVLGATTLLTSQVLSPGPQSIEMTTFSKVVLGFMITDFFVGGYYTASVQKLKDSNLSSFNQNSENMNSLRSGAIGKGNILVSAFLSQIAISPFLYTLIKLSDYIFVKMPVFIQSAKVNKKLKQEAKEKAHISPACSKILNKINSKLKHSPSLASAY